MTKDEALTLAAEMERGQFSTTLLPAAAELRRLHEENRKLRAQEALNKKAENARELGLDYEPKQEPWEKFCDSNCVWTDHHPDCKLAQPEQEPVAWYDIEHGEAETVWNKQRPPWEGRWKPLYTTPPQRKPLRDHEIAKILDRERMKWHKSPPTYEFDLAFARAIEAKLKEKNT